jgi:hypothetical protein
MIGVERPIPTYKFPNLSRRIRMPASIFELFRAGVPWMNQGDIEGHILESEYMLWMITPQRTRILSHVKVRKEIPLPKRLWYSTACFRLPMVCVP